MPYIAGTTFRYINEDKTIYAFGGEAEVLYQPGSSFELWGNLAIREAREDEKHREQEPRLRVNLGGRYITGFGMFVDLALHFTQDHKMPLKDPANLLDEPKLVSLGHQILGIGRLGYRARLGKSFEVETGVITRLPLNRRFREWPGTPLPLYLNFLKSADYGGEVITRLVSFYLKGSF